MTFYESNREVRPTGAEVEEFVTQPEPVPPEPPGAERAESRREHHDDRSSSDAGGGS